MLPSPDKLSCVAEVADGSALDVVDDVLVADEDELLVDDVDVGFGVDDVEVLDGGGVYLDDDE